MLSEHSDRARRIHLCVEFVSGLIQPDSECFEIVGRTACRRQERHDQKHAFQCQLPTIPARQSLERTFLAKSGQEPWVKGNSVL
jgi:hypothetical protein